MKWISLEKQKPELNRYYLIHLNKFWMDKDDSPLFKVAKFVQILDFDNPSRFKYVFKEFGINTFQYDEVDYWCEISKEIK